MNRTTDAPLGGLSVDDFMARHWQRRPLLIRAAMPPDCAPIGVEPLLALAARDEVESRLITQARGRWTLAHGPFEPDDLPARSRPRWTLLVQGVDLHDDAAAALLRRFAFVPHARVDDLMISYASDGGGVGPHIDSYDVFLLQTHGARRWRIGHQPDRTFVPGVPLKILQRFEPTDEWVLGPGDMLYLPPGWAHEGVAQGECTTCSIGFRAPSQGELLRAFLAEAADGIGEDGPRFGDAGRRAARRPGRLPEELRAFAREAIGRWRPSAREIDAFLGRFLTEPKASVFFEPPTRALARRAFEARAGARGVILDRRTRMLADGAAVFINGEREAAAARARAVLARLADARGLEAALVQGLLAEPGAGEQLYAWYRAGWLHAGAARPPRR